MNAEDLIHELTDGRRDRGVCLLSKRQSDWLRDVMARERLSRPSADNPVRVGPFSVQAMGRAFSRNRNGGVLHITHILEGDEERDKSIAEADASAAELLRQQLAEYPAGTLTGDGLREVMAKVWPELVEDQS